MPSGAVQGGIAGLVGRVDVCAQLHGRLNRTEAAAHQGAGVRVLHQGEIVLGRIDQALAPVLVPTDAGGGHQGRGSVRLGQRGICAVLGQRAHNLRLVELGGEEERRRADHVRG